MWAKIKKNKFLIGLIFIFVLKMILVSVQSPIFIYDAGNDDALVLGTAERLLSADWLGKYQSLTLSKGIFASIFVAISNILGIPFLMSEHLFYAGACLAFVLVCRKLIKNDGISLVLFAVLMFNPALYSTQLMRVYRDYIYSSLLLYLVAFLFGIFFNYKEKWTKLIGYMIGFGFAFTFMWICREETIWVVPFVLSAIVITVLFIILDKNCLEKAKKLILYLIPITIFVIIIFGICLLNYIAYGLFTLNQYSGKVWNNFIDAITRVKVEKNYETVPVTKEAMEKLYEVSPSFAELKGYFESEPAKQWFELGAIDGEIEEGWFSWALIAAIDSAGYFSKDAKYANEFFERITNEVNEAYKDGKLEKNEEKRPFFELSKTKELLENINRSYKHQVTLSNMDKDIRIPVDNDWSDPVLLADQVDKFREITGNISTNNKTYNYWVDEVKLNSLINITKVYQKLSPVLFKIAELAYVVSLVLFVIKKTRFKNYKEIILLTGILVLYILRLIVIGYTETTKFAGAISTMYLSCTYSLQFAFELLSIWFLINQFIKIKNKNMKEEKQI